MKERVIFAASSLIVYSVCRVLEEAGKTLYAGYKARRSDPGSVASDVTTGKGNKGGNGKAAKPEKKDDK